ncbi:MAG: hypothetical protein AAB830_03300 [Patescibacteria group bacterium]
MPNNGANNNGLNSNDGQKGTLSQAVDAHVSKAPWAILIGAVVIALAILGGVQLARSNVDIPCSKSVEDQGACSGGAWGQWNIVSQSSAGSCPNSIFEQRTYTGLREIIQGSFGFRANQHTYCNVGIPGGASGTLTSQSAACQIIESRTREVQCGAGAGSANVGSASDKGEDTIKNTTQTEMTGAATGPAKQISATYQDYLDSVDARLATTDLKAISSIVRRGDTTQIFWTSDRVKSCQVVGSNGDSWDLPKSGPNGQTSSPIVEQTVYTFTCKRALSKDLVKQVTVDIIPIFQEK